MEPTVQLLGTPVVSAGGESIEPASGKISALLFYLACAQGWVSRDELTYLLWPDSGDRQARNSLRQLLHRVKDVAYAGALEREEMRLRWMVDTDLARFRAAVAHGAPHVAVNAYGGPLLDGFRLSTAPEFEGWLDLERSQLHEAWRDAVLELSEELESEDRHEEAVVHLARLHRADPLDEPALRQYLIALARAGRSAEALVAAEAFAATLEREVDATPDEATRTLVEAIRHGDTAAYASRQVERPASAARRPMPMPMPGTAFVGRASEVADVVAQLRAPECRLLTVVAPGGMGKTRLAVEVAARMASEFADGVCFVPFEAVDASRLMASAAVDALSITLHGGRDPAEQLLDYLDGRVMLLVLDNLEHLIGDLQLVRGVLARARGVKLLCTSRERLGLHAEWVYDLQGMGVPEADGALGSSDAAELFAQAGTRARHDVRLADDPRSVARICRLVGGMPLALELAASWLRVLDVAQIAEELEQSLDLLQSPLRDMPQRHHDMRGVFGASWQRLSDAERGALLQLCVFRGGFTREAARDVAGVSLPLLLGLANKAFIRHEHGRRFTQHPLLWQYLRARAESSPTFPQLQEQHALHFAALLTDHRDALQGPHPGGARREIEAELENVQTAWQWAIEHRRLDLLAPAAESLYVYLNDEGRYHDSEALFLAASHAAHPESLEAGRMHLFLAGCRNYLKDFPQAVATLGAALPVLETHGAFRDAGLARLLLFSCYGFTNRPLEEGAPLARRARDLFRNAGDRAHEAEAVGLLAEYVQDPTAAERQFEESVRLFEAAGRSFGILGGFTLVLGNYGLFCMQVTGAYQVSVDLYTRAIGIGRARAEPYSVAWSLNEQAKAFIYLGELARAEQCFVAARDVGGALAEGWGMWTLPHALYGLGWVAHLRGDLRAAGRHLDSALERIATHGDTFGTEAQIRLALADLAGAEGRMDEAAQQCRTAFRHYASLNLQQGVREWGQAESLLRLGDIARAGADEAGARAFYSKTLDIAQRWSLLPVALQLCVSVARLDHGRDPRTRSLLSAAARHPASRFATKEAARRLGGVEAGPNAADAEPATTFRQVADALGELLSRDVRDG